MCGNLSWGSSPSVTLLVLPFACITLPPPLSESILFALIVVCCRLSSPLNHFLFYLKLSEREGWASKSTLVLNTWDFCSFFVLVYGFSFPNCTHSVCTNAHHYHHHHRHSHHVIMLLAKKHIWSMKTQVYFEFFVFKLNCLVDRVYICLQM